MNFFSGPENEHLSEGDIIEILVDVTPDHLCKTIMITIDFDPMQKAHTEVVEYLECLEVLDTTDIKSKNQKYSNNKSENKTKLRSMVEYYLTSSWTFVRQK